MYFALELATTAPASYFWFSVHFCWFQLFFIQLRRNAVVMGKRIFDKFELLLFFKMCPIMTGCWIFDEETRMRAPKDARLLFLTSKENFCLSTAKESIMINAKGRCFSFDPWQVMFLSKMWTVQANSFYIHCDKWTKQGLHFCIPLDKLPILTHLIAF